MSPRESVATAVRYWITEQGRRDLLTLETCSCRPKLVGLLFECPDCGTIVGHIRELSLGFGSGYKPGER